MTKLRSSPLPPDSLLAKGCGPGDYSDCFTIDVPHRAGSGGVSLTAFITAFYNSAAFRPERWVLHLIGKGSGGEDVRKLAAGEVQTFAAWSVEARTNNAILMRDFQQRTCSWLAVESRADGTRLYFGSGVRKPEGAAVKLLMPFHRWYAKALLKSAMANL